MVFFYTAKYVKGGDIQSFPITSFGFVSFVLGANFYLLIEILNCFEKLPAIFSKAHNVTAIFSLFVFIMFLILLGVRRKYKQVYKYFNNKGLEKKYNTIFILHITFSILSPLIFTLFWGFSNVVL